MPEGPATAAGPAPDPAPAAPACRPPVTGRPLSVLIVADFGFPHGSGGSSRTLDYARGLQRAGARVKVLCVEPAGTTSMNVAARGVHKGIPFEYSYGRTTRPSSLLARRIRKILKWPRFALAVRSWAAETGGLDAMLVYSRSLSWIAAAFVACRLSGATLLHEDCELPFVWRQATPAMRLRRWAYHRIAFRAFDGCLVISTYLEQYCRGYLRDDARTLLVPILIDVTEVVADDVEPGEPDERLAYCGYMNHPEVGTVLDTFAGLTAEFPTLRLQLIGGSLRPEAIPALQARVRALGLADRVELAGRVDREALFGLLLGARVVMLPRASAPFSQAGLPTKVGEYLATGRPVVVSAVGDLPLYLTDGVDAFLAVSDDPGVFGARVREALLHPAEAAEIGRRGRETARRRFDPAIHGARIAAFITELRESAGRTRAPWSSSNRREASGASSRAARPAGGAR